MRPPPAGAVRPLVIGVGNRWRGDDGVGPRAVDALAAAGCDGVDVLVLDGEPARLVEGWAGRPLVVVVDAVRAGAAPGTIHRVDALAGGVGDQLAGASPASTHAAGVAAAVALGRALGRVPDRLVVLGVEPGSIGHGEALSAPVAAAIDDLVGRVVEEVAAPCA